MLTIDEIFDDVIEKYKQRTAKKCYKAVKVKNKKPGLKDNKIGGVPYIPKSCTIPKDSNGEYMALLLQLNLKDIDLEGYPKEGVLEIFSSTTIDIEMESKTVIFPTGLEPELDLPEINTEEFFVIEPFKITLEEDVVHMPMIDYRCDTILNEILAEYDLSVDSVYDLDDNYDKLYNALNLPLITIGGYADFTQYDFRDENSNLNECIVKMESYDGDMDIGDSGVLCVTCSKDSIQNGSFEGATLYWDCC